MTRPRQMMDCSLECQEEHTRAPGCVLAEAERAPKSKRTGSRRGYTQEDVAKMLLIALRHPPDARLIENARRIIAQADEEEDEARRGRIYRDAVVLIEATTLAASLDP